MLPTLWNVGETMRIHQERKYFVYRDEEDWPDFTMKWGGYKRPITARPTSVTLTWLKGNRFGEDWDDTSWYLHQCYVLADRIYQGKIASMVGVNWRDPADFPDLDQLGPRPQWLVDLITESHPDYPYPPKSGEVTVVRTT